MMMMTTMTMRRKKNGLQLESENQHHLRYPAFPLLRPLLHPRHLGLAPEAFVSGCGLGSFRAVLAAVAPSWESRPPLCTLSPTTVGALWTSATTRKKKTKTMRREEDEEEAEDEEQKEEKEAEEDEGSEAEADGDSKEEGQDQDDEDEMKKDEDEHEDEHEDEDDDENDDDNEEDAKQERECC